MSKNQIKNLADELVSKLKGQGFNILRYDAYSTNSVYLKLDYGVCNTIRISDHEGKKHLQYRYNLIIDGEVNIIEDKYIRYYFNDKCVDIMVNQILFDRKAKVSQYGIYNYRKFMQKNMVEHSKDAGFWSQAKQV